MARSTLYLRPLNGLCNRMQAIAAAKALAAAAEADLVVFWDINDDLGVPYEELFVHDGAFRVHNVDPRLSLRQTLMFLSYANLQTVRGVPTRWIARLAFGGRTLSQVQPGDHDGAKLEAWVRGGQRSLISSWRTFYGEPDVDFGFFTLHPDERAEADAVSAGFDGKTIGVHIRRTDNANAIRRSPTDAFVAAMRQAVAEDPETRFFLTTDCGETQARIAGLFGERVTTRERRISRESLDGMRDAVVDLYLLSRTARIYGSYFSSFSETAAAIGRIPWTTVTDDPFLVGRCNSPDVLVVAPDA